MIMQNKKYGMTLTEVLLAVVLLAGAFLPIMGVMTSSIRATEKDEATIRAVNICQEKINMALQFPFDKFDVGPHSDETVESDNTTGKTKLVFGSEEIDGVIYTSKMDVTSETVEYNVPTPDFEAKGNNPEDPSAWKWETRHYIVDNMLKRFTVTVTWHDKGETGRSGSDKSYTLSSLKADIRMD